MNEPEKPTRNSHFIPPSDSTVDTNVATTFTLLSGAISVDTCISLNNGMLVFSSWECFRNTMNDIINHTSSSLATWETNLGHTSLYSHYETLEEDSTYDDRASDSLRYPNKYFERILNSNHTFRVGDSCFTYDFINSTLTILDHTTQQTSIINIPSILSYKKTSWCDDHNKSETVHETFSAPYSIGMTKYINNSYNDLFPSEQVSEVGITVIHYRKNWLGKWKKKAKRITSLIDKWHELRANRYTLTNWTTFTQIDDKVITDHKWVAEFEKCLSVTIHRSQGEIGDEIVGWCIENWERHHNYSKGNFDNDVHHDTW